MGDEAFCSCGGMGVGSGIGGFGGGGSGGGLGRGLVPLQALTLDVPVLFTPELDAPV